MASHTRSTSSWVIAAHGKSVNYANSTLPETGMVIKIHFAGARINYPQLTLININEEGKETYRQIILG